MVPAPHGRMSPDHPRSRGVYRPSRPATAASGGSSPLARGLRPPELPQGHRPGIIPARAGFTPPRNRQPTALKDHPRSRGVYTTTCATTGRWSGSSPLARGLRPRNRGSARDPGIIPARAGFTFSLAARRSRMEDHPRSRGVYREPCAPSAPAAGSSPLARGLPGAVCAQCARCGIIPARAGFTAAGLRLPPAGQDHPRSRGVYWRRARRWRSPAGSSPLARGLQPEPYSRAATARIIPARAGFTGGRPRTSRRSRDHPRSRGVYPINVRELTGWGGSSPLARGLPQTDALLRPARGIIPARAGFT